MRERRHTARRVRVRETSLRRLGAVGFGAVLFAVVVVFATMAFAIRTMVLDSATQQGRVRALELSNSVERRLIDLETGLRGYLATDQRLFLQPYYAALMSLPEELRTLDGETSEPAQRARLRGIERAISEYESGYAAPLARRAIGDLPLPAAIAITSRGKVLMDALRERFRVFDAAAERASAVSTRASRSSASIASEIAFFGFLFLVTALVAIAAYISRSVLRPVVAVAQAARARGRRNAGVRAPETGIGEIAWLGQSFNEMVDAVETRERALREQTARLEGLMRHTEALIYIKSADGTYLMVNRAYEEARGLKAADIVGRAEAELSPPDLAEQTAASERRVLETGAPDSIEITMPTSSGTRTFLSVKFPIPSADGGVPAIACVSTDVTAQKQALTSAVEAARAKSEFLANMSHELRTPLNGVIGMAHLLADTELTGAQREYVGALEASGEALLAVIGHVLDFSKLEARKLELDPSDFALHRLVQESCLIVGEGARGKGLTLEHRIGEDVPSFVRGDRARLRQILLNLLSNAVKFTADGGVAVTVAREEDGLVRFEVRDTGIGVAADTMSKLFAPFSQADQSTTRKYGGTGLGLAISRELAELMGGRIGVRPGIANGSVFWFTVRLEPAQADDEATSATRRNPLEAGDEIPVVLIAEDNQVNQVVSTRMLEQRGVRVETAWNGAEAVTKAAARRYAVIFMDCQMPELDGYAATRLIRESGDSREVPIIALTAHSMSGGRERCLAAGMDDYLTKPLRPEQLDAVLSRWLLPGARKGIAEVQTTAAEAPAVSGLDDDVVAGIVEGFPPDARAELLDIFRASTHDSVTRLGEAWAARDAGELRRLAHLLKGSGASIGARALSEACRDLEQELSVSSEALATTAESLERIEALAERSAVELRSAFELA